MAALRGLGVIIVIGGAVVAIHCTGMERAAARFSEWCALPLDGAIINGTINNNVRLGSNTWFIVYMWDCYWHICGADIPEYGIFLDAQSGVGWSRNPAIKGVLLATWREQHYISWWPAISAILLRTNIMLTRGRPQTYCLAEVHVSMKLLASLCR